MNLTQMNMMYCDRTGKLVPSYKYKEGKRITATRAIVNFNRPRNRVTGIRAPYHAPRSIPENEIYPPVYVRVYRGP